MFILTLSHMCMTLLLLGLELIDSKIGAGWMGKEPPPPLSSLLDLNLYPLSLIHLPHLLQIMTEF